MWEPVASRLVSEGLARRVATGNQFGENDGALIDVRADLIQQRPDVVKGWLETELEAEQILADPARVARDRAALEEADHRLRREDALAGAVRQLPGASWAEARFA